MEINGKKEQFILDHFEKGLQNHEFIPYIQPKYNIFEEVFYGGEVLCRWKHGEEMIPPSQFIPVLEKYDKIRELDYFMFIETLKIIKNWVTHHITPVPLSVNLSRMNFYDPNIGYKMIQAIDEFDVPHDLIQIEITESAYSEVEEEVEKFMKLMEKENIAVLMDDFGSGYSSLNMLKDINIFAIKVDYRFLMESKIPLRKEKMLEAIVKMTRIINVPMIVEGIEQEKDVILLKSLGVRYVQGFLFAKPMPIKEFDAMARTRIKEKESSPTYTTHDQTEFLNLNSTTYKLFQHSLSAMAICEYTNDELFLNQTNDVLQTYLQTGLLDLRHKRVNVLNMVEESDLVRIKDYINDIVEQKRIDESVECDLKTLTHRVHVRVRISPLSQRGNDSILLMEFVPLYKNQEENDFSDIESILEQLDSGYYVLDENHTILYSNPIAKKMMPHFIPGAKCTDYKRYDEDCSQCPLDNFNMLLSYYSQNLDAFIENYIIPIKWNKREVKLVRIDYSNQGILNSKDAVMRMNQSIARTGDVYTEVDLDTLQYSQITFAKRKVFDIPSIGNYDDSYYEMMEKRIAKESNQEVLHYLSSEGMRREFVDGKKIKVRFKFAGFEAWGETTATFIKDGEKRYCCMHTTDITSEILKDYDYMTKLLNANAIKDRINQYITEYSSTHAALFMIDFDNFKSINDEFGHPYGDQVLQAFGKTLQANLPKDYYIARLGGDEFVFFGPNVKNQENIQSIKELIINQVDKMIEIFKIDHLSGVSMGVASFPSEGQTFADLYSLADERMYKNKAKKKESR